PKRHPVTIDHLIALCDNLSPTNTFDAAVAVVAFCTFWGCCHLSSSLSPCTMCSALETATDREPDQSTIRFTDICGLKHQTVTRTTIRIAYRIQSVGDPIHRLSNGSDL
ncbi:hypothetical protein CPB85DRAFT_1219780, partial [Mucidula mucida]